MLAVILSILKIIGLILLVVLGLVLLLVLLILLVPVRYSADGSYDEKPKAVAKVTWLLHILSVKVTYETEVDICIRVFGIRVKLPSAKSEKIHEEEPVEMMIEKPVKTLESAEKPVNAVLEEPARSQDAGRERKDSQQAEQLLQDEKKASRKGKKKKKADSDQISGSFLEHMSEKVEAVKQKKDEIMEILHNEEYWKTFRLVKRQLFAIVKHLLPKEIRGKVRFGFDDPFKTGQILTYVSPFYALYAKQMQLIPVFEEKVMEGELWLKGRIRIGTILVKAVRLLFDKNIRKLIGKFRKG